MDSYYPVITDQNEECKLVNLYHKEDSCSLPFSISLFDYDFNFSLYYSTLCTYVCMHLRVGIYSK